MRGEASRIADRTSRDTLAPQLKSAGDGAWRISNELFSFTNALDHNVRLERALTDVSRPAADKVAVVRALIGDQAHPTTLTILSDLVSRRWSRAADIANAVEDFGIDAMMYYADATGQTLQVSVELAELHSALLNLSVVRSRLYDDTVPAEARLRLLHSVLDDSGFCTITVRLAEHATCNLRHRRYLATIQWLITKFSRHMGESLVTVTTATPLTPAQIDALSRAYAARLGHAVHINPVVDPTVLGGMRIQVGHEVTDNTVVAQLQHLRRQVSISA